VQIQVSASPKLCKNKFAKAAALGEKREKHATIDFLRGGVGSGGGVGRGRFQKNLLIFMKGKLVKTKYVL
jgi:hypothetical protein